MRRLSRHVRLRPFIGPVPNLFKDMFEVVSCLEVPGAFEAEVKVWTAGAVEPDTNWFLRGFKDYSQ